MLKLLIVEDENKTRSALRACLPWTNLGITEVFEAKNGKQALEMIEREQPSLVITDIRMPEMDGIELTGRIRDMSMPIGVIIISAYSDLPYLKSAIKHDAIDYLLKPIDVLELENAVRKGLEKIYSFSKQQKEQTVLLENLPLLREQFLKSVLSGERYSDEDWVSKMVSYQFERQDNLIYQVCAVRFLDLEPAGSLLFKHVVQNQVQAIVRHLTQHTPFAASFPNRDNELVLVLGLDPLEANEDEGMLLLRRIRESIERNCQYRIDLWYAVGIHSLRDIAKSYEQLNPLDPLETDNRGFSMQDRESLMVQSIKKHVETHYWNEHLTVNDIAEEIRYTTAYVCMIFKKETGITLNQFINMYRIGKAKELLKDVTLKLAEVAEMVGYSNENYFSKVFKKYEGYSPSDLKKGGKRE